MSTGTLAPEQDFDSEHHSLVRRHPCPAQVLFPLPMSAQKESLVHCTEIYATGHHARPTSTQLNHVKMK